MQDHLQRFFQSQQPDSHSQEAYFQENQAQNDLLNDSLRKNDTSKLDPNAPQYIPSVAENPISLPTQALPDAGSQTVLEDHLFPIWLKAFETLTESRAVNPTERLHFLGRYVGGKATELIEGFMLMDGEDAYNSAKQMLVKRYRDSFAVGAAFRKKRETWPHIQPQDSLALRRYADFLVQCEKAMATVDSLKALNDDKEIQKMSSKLPKMGNQ